MVWYQSNSEATIYITKWDILLVINLPRRKSTPTSIYSMAFKIVKENQLYK